MAVKRASGSQNERWRLARDAGWLRTRPALIPSSGVLLAVAAWIVAAVALLVAFIFLAGLVGAPRAVLIVPVVTTLAYVGRQGHYALWPRTVPLDPPWGVVVIGLLLQIVVLVLGALLLLLLGLLESGAVSTFGLVLMAYVLAWQWRWVEATSARIRTLRYVLCGIVLVVVGVLIAYDYGLQVKREQVQAFYSTMAQVDAALLIATAFQPRLAQDRRSLEAFVFLAGWGLAVSLTCSLWAIGRGADTATLLALTIVGSATGLVLVGLAVIQNTAPDLLTNRRPGRHQRAPISVADTQSPAPDGPLR